MVGRSGGSVGTEMVGSTGGSVGGGADVFVAGTEVRGTEVLVRGMDVRVGLTRVSVGRSVDQVVAVGPGSRVRRVAVTGSVAVSVGVRVGDGVAVGMVDVMVGISVGVRVGAVEVGKGPSSASEVRASAVLVPAAPKKPPASLPEPTNANQIQSRAAMRAASSPRVRRLDRLPVKFNACFLFGQRYGYVVGGMRVRVGLGVAVAGGRGVLVNVARGWLVRAVKVTNTRGVAVGVGVRVGVRVGVQVGVKTSVAVTVGSVEVGNGPSRACEVSARAVRVLLASCCEFAAPGDSREVSL